MQQGECSFSIWRSSSWFCANEQYKPYISTNPHGDRQPGYSQITHMVPKPHTRQSEANDTSSSTTERVADFVVFDLFTKIYTIVAEIKCDDTPPEQQNIHVCLPRGSEDWIRPRVHCEEAQKDYSGPSQDLRETVKMLSICLYGFICFSQ